MSRHNMETMVEEKKEPTEEKRIDRSKNIVVFRGTMTMVQVYLIVSTAEG